MKNKYIGVDTLEILGDAKNYNKWISNSIKPYLKNNVIEIGAGTGNISEYIINSFRVELTDIDFGLVKKLRVRFKSNRIVVSKLNIEFGIPKNYASKFSSVYLVNVLEHIKNDNKALDNINMLLKNKGRVVVLVPAKKVLYTQLDKNIGHYRRYEKEELVSKFEKSGFKVISCKYFNFVGIVSWWIRDKITSDHSKLPKNSVKLFDRIVPTLSFFENLMPPPIGISLIIVGEKNE